MAIESLPLGQYKRGFVLGANGHQNAGIDVMGEKIPQLHALLKVLTDTEWSWNDAIKTELIYLASGVANDIHEAYEEYLHESNLREKKLAA
ncbi:hypothetical protein [Polaromonas sp. AER18D-145]|uniref:hypothetical protein n=1 Tax=Polaromonas sp. AER18D-145 TaxID=1977060 RepID=UPI00114150A7|nr:hypothetical protein [Polaromonas sp. AER18D-145]